jgi:tRNA A37 threonylcarbamoyladenosine synthetase subunit TsaC/SUA5/YrdC
LIHDKFEKLVNVVIDGGIGGMVPSTIISFVSGEAEVVREGAGEVK